MARKNYLKKWWRLTAKRDVMLSIAAHEAGHAVMRSRQNRHATHTSINCLTGGLSEGSFTEVRYHDAIRIFLAGIAAEIALGVVDTVEGFNYETATDDELLNLMEQKPYADDLTDAKRYLAVIEIARPIINCETFERANESDSLVYHLRECVTMIEDYKPILIRAAIVLYEHWELSGFEFAALWREYHPDEELTVFEPTE